MTKRIICGLTIMSIVAGCGYRDSPARTVTCFSGGKVVVIGLLVGANSLRRVTISADGTTADVRQLSCIVENPK